MSHASSRSWLGVIALGACALMSGRVFAHHSFAMFDHDKEVTLEGTVKEFQWTNPHAWVQLMVQSPDGPVEWSIEVGSPSLMSRSGWKRSSIKPGDKASLVIHPLRSGEPGGSLVQATINGQVMGSGAAVPGGDAAAPGGDGQTTGK